MDSGIVTFILVVSAIIYIVLFVLFIKLCSNVKALNNKIQGELTAFLYVDKAQYAIDLGFYPKAQKYLKVAQCLLSEGKIGHPNARILTEYDGKEDFKVFSERYILIGMRQIEDMIEKAKNA